MTDSPKHSDAKGHDAVDDECPLPPSDAVCAIEAAVDAALDGTAHHRSHCLHRVVEADPLGHLEGRVPGHCERTLQHRA